MPEEAAEFYEEDASPGEMDEPAMALEAPEPEEPQLLASLESEGPPAVPEILSEQQDDDGNTRFRETRDAEGDITVQGASFGDEFAVEAHYDDGFLGLGILRQVDGVTVSTQSGFSKSYLGEEADNLTLRGGAGGDTFAIDAAVQADLTIEAGNGSDTIQGGGGNETIDGGRGDDAIDGGGGDDTIAGERGDDLIRGGLGNDTIDAGEGNDTIDGGGGDDKLTGGAGDDVLHAGHGRDTLEDIQGNNWFIAQAQDRVTAADQAQNETTTAADPLQVPVVEQHSFAHGAYRNFDNWDLDDDGLVEKAETIQLMSDPSIEGQDAATLGTLRSMQGQADTWNIGALSDDGRFPWSEDPEGMSQADLLAYTRLGEDDENRKLTEAYFLRTDNYIEGLSAQTRSQGLFTGDGTIEAADVEQGNAGTCNPLSALIGELSQDPEAVQERFGQNADGSFSVELGSGEQKVAPLTDAERAYFGRAENGDWQAVYEKAVLQAGLSGDGNNFENTIRAVTGNDSTAIALDGEHRAEALSALESALEDDRLALASLSDNEDEKQNGGIVLPDNHAYAVVGYEDGQVEMQNPWGREEPKGANGRPRDGKDDGRFTVSKDEFIDTFDWLGVEQPPRRPGGGR